MKDMQRNQASDTSGENATSFTDAQGFMDYRKEQERGYWQVKRAMNDTLSAILAVELNITELCNRKCAFCPRVDPSKYPNRNLNMPVAVAERIGDQLRDLKMSARISMSGFGEPLLHRRIEDLIHALRKRLPDNVIEMNTSGDRLTLSKIEALNKAGITNIYVNLYDGPEQIAGFEDLFRTSVLSHERWKLRPHWPDGTEDFGLILNNRAGNIIMEDRDESAGQLPLKSRCFYPFYKVIIDWNGDLLFCSNDWGRKIIIGNIMRSDLRDIWLSDKMNNIRKRLAHGDRSFTPCKGCNVDGTRFGEKSFNILMSHIEEDELQSRQTKPVV